MNENCIFTSYPGFTEAHNFRSGDLQTHLIKLCIVSVMTFVLTHIFKMYKDNDVGHLCDTGPVRHLSDTASSILYKPIVVGRT